MTTPHTPPTQAELDEWKDSWGAMTPIGRLIAEVERLWTDRDEIKSGWSKANDDLARLTKEVEELRKDKERLRWILLHRSEFYNGSLTIEDVDSITAMQQKGEE